jgi:hypothetical protein
MNGFSDYLKKAVSKEKEITKDKKIKLNENDSSFSKYLKKSNFFLEEETNKTETEDEYVSDDADTDSSEEQSTSMSGETEDSSDDYEKDEDEEAMSSSCPISTKDQTVNIENRQKAIDEFVYGPEKIDEVNDEFWNEKKTKFMEKTTELAKQKLCGNCAAFSLKANMLKCLDDGIDKTIDENDIWDSKGEDRGYCEFLEFKCHAKRTCNSWVEGGPLKD